jgi:hypothetical protein
MLTKRIIQTITIARTASDPPNKVQAEAIFLDVYLFTCASVGAYGFTMERSILDGFA